MKFPKNLNHKALETYVKDPLEFEARYIYGLKSKEPFKRFVKRIAIGRLESHDDPMDGHAPLAMTESIDYDDAIFWHYQKSRILNSLKEIAPLYQAISKPLGDHVITETIDYVYDKTLVCFTTKTPPKQKDIKSLESLRMVFCAYCAEGKYDIESYEYWHLKGYKDIVEKVKYPQELILETLEHVKNLLNESAASL
ncbi:MAG: hypothetical protein H6850_01420 [Alphaproteobacteria bacterium]|nr:MAG: hypothetical protein H6850_01420 [Alphaproteobacteria bacterium]